jgi:hypothetical protein
MPGSVIRPAAPGAARPAAAGQEAVHIVVVHEAGHQVRPRVQPLAGVMRWPRFGGGPAARKHVAQRAVEREVEHARQQRAAIGAGHVASRSCAPPGPAAACRCRSPRRRHETAAARCPGHLQHAGRARIVGLQEVGNSLRRHIKRRVHAEGIHPHLADPVPVTARSARRTSGFSVFRSSSPTSGSSAPAAAGCSRPRRASSGRWPRRAGPGRAGRCGRTAPGVGAGTGGESGHALPTRGRVARAPAVAIGEEVAGVVEHDVLHQEHAAPVQAARQRR